MVEKGAISPEKIPLPMDPPAWRENPSGFFHNLGNLLSPLVLMPASRERVVPSEWQVRTVLREVAYQEQK